MLWASFVQTHRLLFLCRPIWLPGDSTINYTHAQAVWHIRAKDSNASRPGPRGKRPGVVVLRSDVPHCPCIGVYPSRDAQPQWQQSCWSVTSWRDMENPTTCRHQGLSQKHGGWSATALSLHYLYKDKFIHMSIYT